MEDKKNHNFWDRQCIIDYNNINNIIKNDYIDKDIVEKVIKLPITPLPKNMKWEMIDLKENFNEIYNFYNYNYSPILTKDLFIWELLKAYEDKNFNLFIKDKINNELLGGIFGIPMTIRIYGKKINTYYVFYLCVHPELRNLNSASILINEIIRKIGISGKTITSLYIAMKKLPNTININPIKFFKFEINSIKGKYIKNVEIMKDVDYEECMKKINKFNKKFKLNIKFRDLKDFKEVFNNKVVKCFVIKKNNEITDFISVYEMGNKSKKNKEIKLYYYFNNTIKMIDIFNHFVEFGKDNNYDLISFNDIMDYKSLTKEINMDLDIAKLDDDNGLFYYLYNWECPKLENNEIAILPGS